MADFGRVMTRTAKAAANLSTMQYRFVRSVGSTAGEVNMASHSAILSYNLAGVLQNKPTSGQAATVGYLGETKVIVGSGGVSANGWLTSNQSGMAVHAASGDAVFGISLEAGSHQEMIRALLYGPARIDNLL